MFRFCGHWLIFLSPNALWSILPRLEFSWIITFLRYLHLLYAYYPISSTDNGMPTNIIDELSNAFLDILLRLEFSWNETVVRFTQNNLKMIDQTIPPVVYCFILDRTDN